MLSEQYKEVFWMKKIDKRRVNWITKEALYTLYWIENKTLEQIGNQFGRTKSTISYLMIQWNIPRRNLNWTSKEELQQLHWQKNLTLTEIARLLNQTRSNVRQAMVKWKIPIRKRIQWITKEELYDLYWNKNINVPNIAQKFNRSYASIIHLFRRWKIPTHGNKKYYTSEDVKQATRNTLQKSYQKEKSGINYRKREKRVKRFIDKVVLLCGCKKCGYKKITGALEFHHRDPKTKSFDVKSRLRISIDTLKKEMRKCDILCVNCHREEHARLVGVTYDAPNQRFVNEISIANKCCRCGYNKNIKALEFHHRDPNTKKFAISCANRYTIEEVQSEMYKCDILCANCHREVHQKLRRIE